jgi:DNA primase
MIPDDVITQIRDASDIVAVIGQHVQLKRAGRSWRGLCPFHGEKTPSFNVIPHKGFFHCFGCQKNGDVFAFVMELEGKSFVEAAEQLAARFGIAVPRIEESPELRKARGERVAMLDLNKLATAFYREVLADPRRGEPGRAYLAKRGVSAEIADKFQLGYAPPEWSALVDHLKAKRCDLELAVKLGLVAHRPNTAGFYDRNRDRLVCPVIVPGGDIVGFSARVVDPAPAPPPGTQVPPDRATSTADAPKYINSPESAVYKKGKLLYGLAQAREAMATAKRAVLVEGNFDVITLHQAGFTEVVAPLGTALTPEQIGVLKRLTERVVLLYDGDRAGYKATMHALQLCIEAEVEVQVASRPGNARSGGAGPLSDGVDPDSLVASGGVEQLREAVHRAQGGFEFFVFEVWSKARGNADARSRALEDAVRLLAKVANPTKRDLIVGLLATGLDLDTSVIRNAVARVSGGGGSGGGSGAGPGPTRDHSPGRDRHPNAPDPGSAASGSSGTAAGKPAAPPLTEELELISLFADHPTLIATSEADRAFWLLTDGRLRDMYSAARAGQVKLQELASTHLPSSSAAHVLSGKYIDSKDPRAALLTMIVNLECRKAGVDLVDLKKAMTEAYRRGDRDLARRLAQLAEAERKGDRELVARLRESLANETTNGKQVD